MTRTTTLTTIMKFIPALMLAAFTVAGFFGVTSLMGQIPGTEYDCKVTQFEKVADHPNELLIHTDGCSDSASKEGKVFKANTKELAANFTEEKFYEGVKAGKTFNIMVEGMTVKQFNMIPTITKVSESVMPY
jgi:hypothetical protein